LTSSPKKFFLPKEKLFRGFSPAPPLPWNHAHEKIYPSSIIPAGQFVTKFATSIAGGTPPDVAAIDLIYLPAFNEAGQMTDLTAEAKALPFFDKLSPSHVRLATYEGKLYAVPFSAEASVLVYNTELFKKAGLDPERPPANFAEIEQDAQKITALLFRRNTTSY
jgi:multiple sugar transport system substrate-binding protein